MGRSRVTKQKPTVPRGYEGRVFRNQGLACPKCEDKRSLVIDKRNREDWIHRRRLCVCGNRYTTKEFIDEFPKGQKE